MMYGDKFNIANIEFDCEIYGPGRRTVIWFQGCTLCCKGCWNESMHSVEPNELIGREDLLKTITDSKCDGVTFLGGEPLQQPENLLWLMRKLKTKKTNVVLYTGYEEDEISASDVFSEICRHADILISGRYVEKERNIFLKWRGSENQKVSFKNGDRIAEECNEMEIRIAEDGSITCLGYPADEIRCILR